MSVATEAIWLQQELFCGSLLFTSTSLLRTLKGYIQKQLTSPCCQHCQRFWNLVVREHLHSFQTPNFDCFHESNERCVEKLEVIKKEEYSFKPYSVTIVEPSSCVIYQITRAHFQKSSKCGYNTDLKYPQAARWRFEGSYLANYKEVVLWFLHEVKVISSSINKCSCNRIEASLIWYCSLLYLSTIINFKHCDWTWSNLPRGWRW